LDPFVFIPGAWHGAWCWEPTIRALERRGREAYAPELAGLGPSEADPGSVRLADQVEGLAQYITDNDLIDVVLVGVDAGAALMPMVFEAVPVAIDGLIFIDGLIPQPGESVVEVAERLFPGAAAKWTAAAEQNHNALPPDDSLLSWMLAELPETQRDEARSRMRSHPYQPLTEPVSYTAFPSAPPFRAYIRCQRTPLTNPGLSMAHRAHADLYPLGAGHDAMLSQPELLADRLLEIVDMWNSGDVPARGVG
jgi:pimeloyl-ACP methyl ester carboxylesterase